MSETKSYCVRGIEIDHDGKRYAEGDRIELDDATAQSLRRWLEPAEPIAPATPITPAKPKGEPKKPAGDGAGQPESNGGQGSAPADSEQSKTAGQEKSSDQGDKK
jgi:hypothetical protein